MRKRLLLAAAAAVLVLLGIAAALLIATMHGQPSGKLDTELTGVSVVSPTAPPPTYGSGSKNADRRCWRMFGGDPQRSLSRPELNLGIPVKRPLWVRGLHDYIEYAPSYCDGVIYVNTFKGDTWAIEAQTGKVTWRRRGNGPKPSTPAIAGPYLIVSSTDGTVTALARSNGRTVWQLRTNSKVESSAAIADGMAYFGATDGRLFAVDAATGKIHWAYDTGGRINSSPSIFGNRICITTYAGSIFCLRRSDAHKLWSTYVKRDPIRYDSFYASPSTDGERLYTISRSGDVVTLDAVTGKVLWTHQISSLGYTTPALAGDRVFVGGFDGALHAYEKRTGKEVWRAQVGGRIIGAPIVVGRLVFFSTLEQQTYAARISDGRVVWHIGIGKYSPGIATERAYYFTLNGLLVAFRGRYSPP
jgi:outer membrane protein assembly factor BamB